MKNKKIIILTIVAVTVIASAAAYIALIPEEDKKNNTNQNIEDPNGNQNETGGEGSKNYYFYSFENGMNGWTKNGLDLDHPPINWSVETTTNESYSDNSSVKFYLDNINDAGKIWMEKFFDVEKNSLYDVDVRYKFGTSDFGTVNLFKIITTISVDNISNRDDLVYQGETGNNKESEEFVWLNKSIDSIIETNENGSIYINIGVWGSHETNRTYYVDDVNITIKKVKPVENTMDLSGNWTLKNYDFLGELTSEQNVTISQNGSSVTIEFEDNTTCTGTVINNTLQNPLVDTDYLIKGCDFGGLDIDTIFIIDENNLKTETPGCETCNPSEFTKQ